MMIRSVRNCIADPTPYPLGMWEPPKYSEPSKIAQRYIEALRLDSSAVALREPFGFVFPYIRLLTMECYADFTYNFDPRPITALYQRDLEKQHAVYSRIVELDIIIQAVSGIIRSMRTSRSSAVPRFTKILEDLRALRREHDLTAKYHQLEHDRIDQEDQQEVISEQLDEAKQSKATAVSVGRLTKLAFVYIPLNFVAAVLGMNLAIFGNGTISLWVFFALAAILVCFSVLPILDSVIRTIKSSPLILDTGRACLLAWRSPSCGFWYWLFCLLHTESANIVVRYDCQLSGSLVDCLERRGKRRCYTSRSYSSIINGTSAFGFDQFWVRRVEGILKLVDVPDWQDLSFISRWTSGWRSSRLLKINRRSSSEQSPV